MTSNNHNLMLQICSDILCSLLVMQVATTAGLDKFF